MKNDEFVFGSLPKASKYLKEGDTVSLGNNIIKVIETAGHTAGGICFLVNDELFTGDTLFQGSIGRSDFPGGNGAQLIKNIKEKLLPLGDGVKVYPGHGPASTIGYEKRNNPFL
jgi:glyoxylase-like metal-dependent hydrolase (beta-lactamase superfamily II)